MINIDILRKSREITTLLWKTDNPKESENFTTINYLVNGILDKDFSLPINAFTKNFDRDLEVIIASSFSLEKIQSDNTLLIED